MSTEKFQITLPNVIVVRLNDYCEATGFKKSSAIINLLNITFEKIDMKGVETNGR